MFSKIKYHSWDLKKRGIEDHTWGKNFLFSCYGRNITLIIGSFQNLLHCFQKERKPSETVAKMNENTFL
jgi:hypothetical protein